ncbi:MAG: TolC family protein [Bacteroidales bacterium]|nr:TolC family protein [Bacteroidales bacterium]
MKQLIFIITYLLININTSIAQETLSFENLNAVLNYAEKNSTTVKKNEQQTLIAKWQKISAKTGLINFRMQTTFNMTDNIELPITYLPAEAFGGEPGTFKEVTTGQKYISNLNIIPQIDIINPESWAKLKSANINYALTEINNKIARKSLFESIAASYYNIVSLQDQITITEKTLLTADSLLSNMKNKYSKGIVRLQDLNDIKVSKILTRDKLQQLKTNLEKQYYSLKILCDIPEKTNLIINEKPDYDIILNNNPQVQNQLKYKQSLLNAELAEAEVKKAKFMQLPVLSLISYNAWQQNSNLQFFDPARNWIYPKYIGLKISLPFPNISAFTQTKTAKINKTISLQNVEHTKIQNDTENKQLVLDYKKAYSQFVSAKEIYKLKEQNYYLMLNQFNLSILPPDRLLTAYNDMLISKLNYSNALAEVLYSKTKIDINNTIQ